MINNLKYNTLDKNKSLKKTLTEFMKIKEFPRDVYDKKDTINVVFLGQNFVGKSSIAYQFVNCKFEPYYIQTMYREISKKIVSYEGRKFELELSVTSGVKQYQEDYSDIFITSDFFIVCYDITSNDSITKAKEIITNDLLPYYFQYDMKYSNIFLFGNKNDLKERKVKYSDVEDFAKKYKIAFYETSAKNNSNISIAFNKMIEIYNLAIFPQSNRSSVKD